MIAKSDPTVPSKCDESGTRDEIIAVVAAYEQAFNDNDAKAMNALFSDDTIFVNFGGNLVFGSQQLYRAQAFVFQPGGALENITVGYLVESVVFLAPNIAVAHTRQRTAETDGTLANVHRDPMESILTLVLTRDDQSGWRIRFGQNTPVTAPTMKSDGSH